MINALVNSGIDKNDIATTNVTLQPQYGGGDSPSIIAYQASNSVTVKIRNLNTASQTLGLIGTTGGDATRITSVSYAIDDDSQLVRDARTRAFDDAKGPCRAVRPAGGAHPRRRHLDLRVGRDDAAHPDPHADARAAAMEAVPLEPGQQTVSFSVTAIWELT